MKKVEVYQDEQTGFVSISASSSNEIDKLIDKLFQTLNDQLLGTLIDSSSFVVRTIIFDNSTHNDILIGAFKIIFSLLSEEYPDKVRYISKRSEDDEEDERKTVKRTNEV